MAIEAPTHEHLQELSLNAPAERLRCVELFAGAGGLAMGLHAAGFEPALVVEYDRRACQTLRINGELPNSSMANWPVRECDVRAVDYAGLDGIDLLSAGAPCQPFSVGGLRKGKDDDRNMLPEVIRAVRELRPRAFILENVRGLLFDRARPYFDSIIAQLRTPSVEVSDDLDLAAVVTRLAGSDEEYRVAFKVLNAADYGLAQNRHRLVIVGMRADQPEWTWPEATHNRDALILAMRGDEYWDEHRVPNRIKKSVREELTKAKLNPIGQRWNTLRDLMKRLGPPHGGANPLDPAHVVVPGARLYRRHTGSQLDWPAKTVKAGVHGCPGGEHIVVLDDGSHRYLTVRECAALQGFPDNYILPEGRSSAMRQLGNAVPVALAKAVGEKLAEVLS